MARVALFLSDGQMLQTGHLQPAIREDSSTSEPVGDTLKDRLEAVEKREIEASMRRHEGNFSAAARELGVARSTLYRRLEELGLDEVDRI